MNTHRTVFVLLVVVLTLASLLVHRVDAAVGDEELVKSFWDIGSAFSGYLSDHHPSDSANTSAHGSNFYTNQSFYLTNVTLMLSKTGSPTVNLTLGVYDLTNQSLRGLPTGDPLVVSDAVNASTLIEGLYWTYNFSFSTTYNLRQGDYFGIALRANSTGTLDGSNRVNLRLYNTTNSAYIVTMYNSSGWTHDIPADWFTLDMQMYGTYSHQTTFHGLYNEVTGELYAAASRAVDVTAYFDDGTASETFQVNGTYLYNSSTVPLYYRFELGAVDRQYWLAPTQLTGTTIYICNTTLTAYTIQFLDLSGALTTYPYVTVQRTINGSDITVEKRKVDSDKKVVVACQQDEKYTIIVGSADTTYTYGDLLFTSTTDITLTLKGIEFPQTVILAYRYVRLYAYRLANFTAISCVYEDTTANTSSVSVSIAYTNGSIVYSTTQYSNSFNVTWTGAAYNVTYQVLMQCVHNEYSNIDYHTMLYRGGYNVSPWSIDFFGTISGGMATSVLIPTFLIFCSAVLFSRINVYVGGLAAWVVAVFMAWWGWMLIDVRMLILAGVFAVLLGMAYHKRRVTVR